MQKSIGYILDTTYKYEDMVTNWVDVVYDLIARLSGESPIPENQTDIEEQLSRLTPAHVAGITRIVEGYEAIEKEKERLREETQKEWAKEAESFDRLASCVL